MIIPKMRPFDGQHCETTTAGTLLRCLGIEVSEAMLFGLGQGLGFIYWTMKSMPHPFIGGRIKPDHLTANLCANLNLQLNLKETSSKKKAWSTVQDLLERNIPVGLKLDSYHLEYFTTKVHFAGHYVAMYGYDDDDVFLVDTRQQGGAVKTSKESLALARAEKGPMSSKNLAFWITDDKKRRRLKDALIPAIINNCRDYLNPPIKNFGFKGIKKTADSIETWFLESDDVKRDFTTTAMLMEKAGTGGALFRNMYRDFLFEAADILSSKDIEDCAASFASIAKQWTSVAELLNNAGSSGNVDFIQQASGTLSNIAELERKTISRLFDFCFEHVDS